MMRLGCAALPVGMALMAFVSLQPYFLWRYQKPAYGLATLIVVTGAAVGWRAFSIDRSRIDGKRAPAYRGAGDDDQRRKAIGRFLISPKEIRLQRDERHQGHSDRQRGATQAHHPSLRQRYYAARKVGLFRTRAWLQRSCYLRTAGATRLE